MPIDRQAKEKLMLSDLSNSSICAGLQIVLCIYITIQIVIFLIEKEPNQNSCKWNHF